MKTRNKVNIILLLFTINLGLLLIFYGINHEDKAAYLLYNSFTKIYSIDPEVKNIADNCENSVSKIECVYKEIPFTYDHDRVGDGGLYTPSQMIKIKGKSVCRDIAVFRKAVLDRLNIRNEFIITEDHIEVIAWEEDKIYVLSNGYINRLYSF